MYYLQIMRREDTEVACYLEQCSEGVVVALGDEVEDGAGVHRGVFLLLHYALGQLLLHRYFGRKLKCRIQVILPRSEVGYFCKRLVQRYHFASLQMP